MFSHHPFTVHGRCSLHVSPALPTWKRVLDLVCCAVGFPVLGLVAFLTSVAALFSSGGPIIFRQEKVSPSGRRFGMYRFRTMRAWYVPVAIEDGSNANRVRGRAETPDLIPGGGFLRATGLVDLPQLVNVLRGEMSIVGPRPNSFSASSRSGFADDQRVALPGLTGPWRFCGETSEAPDEVRQWDRTYAETWTLGGDIGIIARSFWAGLNFRSKS